MHSFKIMSLKPLSLFLMAMSSLANASETEVIDAISASFNGAKVESIVPHESGMFEVRIKGGPIVYANTTGKYIFSGDLYKVLPYSAINLTRQAAIDDVNRVPDRDMIAFKAKNEKAVVRVFTDVSCTYCRQMQSQMAEYNDLGITIKYLAYPRSGLNTRDSRIMDNVWCSPDRRVALVAAKTDQPIPKSAKCRSPVNYEYNLGKRMSISGTPLLVAGNTIIEGYYPPAMLAKKLGLIK